MVSFLFKTSYVKSMLDKDRLDMRVGDLWYNPKPSDRLYLVTEIRGVIVMGIVFGPNPKSEEILTDDGYAATRWELLAEGLT